MAAIKISSKVDEKVWAELRAMADEQHQSVSGLLTEAISEYLQRRRVRPDVLKHLDDSIDESVSADDGSVGSVPAMISSPSRRASPSVSARFGSVP